MTIRGMDAECPSPWWRTYSRASLQRRPMRRSTMPRRDEGGRTGHGTPDSGWDDCDMNAGRGKPAFGPLEGLRVIDAGTMIAGPLGATQLADFGADVIKIELPGVGDPMRDWAPSKEDQVAVVEGHRAQQAPDYAEPVEARRAGAVQASGGRRRHRHRELPPRDVRTLGARLPGAGEGQSAGGAGARVGIRSGRTLRGAGRLRNRRRGVQRRAVLHRFPRSAPDVARDSPSRTPSPPPSPRWRRCSPSTSATRAASAPARRST